MHVLHGTWVPEARLFALWGENTAVDPRTRFSKRAKVAPHPYDLGFDALLNYVAEFAPKAQPSGGDVTIWLPGVGKLTQPSPEARASGLGDPEGTIQLLRWRVEAITLRPMDVLELLIGLPAGTEPGAGLALGGDLRFWQQAALLVLHALIEQRYTPTLEQQPGGRLAAGWQPDLEAGMLARMARNMPPLCRALAPDPASAPQPLAMIEHFLQTCLDAFIRRAGARVPSARLPRLARAPWLKALIGEDRRLAASAPEAKKFYETWQGWRGLAEIAGTGTGAFRVCFRLEEPAETDPEQEPVWGLSYLLQAADDPSLLIDAATVWRSRGKTLTYLERRFDQPHERLLAALGVAARFFPPVERSLRSAKPTGVPLSSEEAYRFFSEAAPALEGHGFGVLVPNWARRSALKARAKIAARQDRPDPAAVGGMLSFERLASYEWEFSVGGQTISQAEFEQLVALKQPLVRFRGEWIALDPKQIEAARRFFERQPAGAEMGLLDVLKLTAGDHLSAGIAEAGSAESASGLVIEAASIEGWLADLLEQLRRPDQAAAPAIPAGLHGTLRPYQERGFGWLAQMRRLGLGACLADDMGLGKTITTLALWLALKEFVPDSPAPALLVSPTSVVGNWKHEISRFAPSLRVMLHQGAARPRGEDFSLALRETQPDVVLTSYALLSRDLETLRQVAWAGVVLDEAQNIKNPATRQAQAARALTAGYRLALTGTPVENRLGELWSILHFLNPGYLGSREAFRARFAIPIERYGDEQAAAALRRLTAPFILRRLKTDPNVISDLPEKFENKVYCSLTPEQATLYEAIVREELEAIDSAESDMQRRGNVLRMLTRLKQVCNHPAHLLKEGEALGVAALQGRSGKLTRLAEMLEEVLSAGDCALVFTQYAEMGAHLQTYLSENFEREVLFLHGGTPAEKRQEMIGHFQAPRGPSIFVLSLKAGGTGLNLTRANHVFHFDRWYNPAVENQATDRAFRIGQTRNVQVHKFICLGTLEERIDELIARKQDLAEKIVGEGESWLSEMSTDDLRGLVTLRREIMDDAE